MDVIEEQVCEGLQRLADPVEAEVDLETVIAGGQRLRRGRRGGWAIAGVAAASVAVLLAWPAIIGGSVPAVPAPVATPTPPVESSAQPVSDRVVLEFSQWDPSLGYDQVEIEVVRTGDNLAVGVTAGSEDAPEATGSYTSNAGEFWSVPVADDLVVALIPDRTSSVTSVGGGWEPVDSGWLSGVELTAVAVQRDSGNEDFGGLTWQSADGEVHSSKGNAASAVLSYAGGTVVVYRDEALQVWGYIDRANGDSEAKPLDTEPVATLAGLSATSEGDYFVDFVAVGFLPPGGTDPELVLTQDNITWTSEPLGNTGQLAILAVADRIKQGQPLVESITYTDTEGKRVTYNPYP